MSAVNVMQLSVEGVKELNSLLKTLEPKLRRRALSRAARESMRPALAEAKTNAPKGKTKHLSQSIKLRAMKKRRNYVGVYVGFGEKFWKGDTFYGAFQEFGWHVGKRSKEVAAAQRRRTRKIQKISKLLKKKKYLRVLFARLSGNRSVADTRKFKEGLHFLEKSYEGQKASALSAFQRRIPIEIERIKREASNVRK